MYYVLDGMIYQAPTILSVLNARLRRCAFMLNRAQSTLSRCVSFDMGQGDMYRLGKPSGGEGEAAAGGAVGEEEGNMDIDDNDGSTDHEHLYRQGWRRSRRTIGSISQPHPDGREAVGRVLATLIEDFPTPAPKIGEG